MPLNAFKGTSADEEDVLGIDVDEFLFRVLAAALGGNVHYASLKEFEHCLLHAFSGNVSGDGRIVALTGNLVYLIYEHNAAFCLLEIEIGLLKEPCEDALHVLSHVTGLREHGGVNNGERDVKHLGDGTCKEGFSGAGGADK